MVCKSHRPIFIATEHREHIKGFKLDILLFYEKYSYLGFDGSIVSQNIWNSGNKRLEK